MEHEKAEWQADWDAIHWAGTETATEWYAYMDGAVASGQRAASEASANIKKYY